MISSIGNNNNIELLLQSYRQLEERPIRTLETRRDDLNERIRLFNSLKNKLTALKNIAQELGYSGSTSVFGSKTATSSDTSVLTVSASASAVVTTHTIFVSQLAKADQVVSNQYSSTGTDIVQALGSGTYTFEVTVNSTTTQVSIEIEDGDTNETILDKIVTAVNNSSDIGIRASVIQDTDSTSRLVFTSEETGADYEMSLSDVSGTLLSTIGMNDSVAMSGTSGGYVYETSELNAILTIDGISVERNSNTIEDAIEGITITLLKTQEVGEQPVTVNVTSNTENIRSKIEDFINKYNEVIDFINQNTSVNTSTYERSAFSGDFSIMNLKLQLRTAIAEPVTGLDPGFPTILSEIGISTDRSGRLSISDSDKLGDMIQEHLDQVEALFNSSDGFSSRLVDILSEMTGGEGVIEKRKDVLQSQISYINRRIQQLQSQVDKKLEYYRQQFSQLQTAMAEFSAQFNFINNLFSNLL